MSTGIAPLTAAQEDAAERQALREDYLRRFLVALDQFMNVVTDGDPDETISSRAARAAEKHRHWGVALSKVLDCFQHDHGAKAQAGDLARAGRVVITEEQSGSLPK